jgi:hypothetical protein
MTTPLPKCRAVVRGRWEVVGRACACGGPILIERMGRVNVRYETFCGCCLRCDPNGRPTRAECLANLAYFDARGPKESRP